MKLVEEIVVKPDEEKFMWGIDTSLLAYDAMLIVEMGCQALYLVNGRLARTFDAGRYVINPKKERRENNSISLVGVNRGKSFTLVWGVGEIPFRDRDSKVETEIGMNGEYTIQLLQPANLYTSLGKADVTPEEVAAKTRAKLSETLKTQLSKQLGGYTYLTIQSAQGQISEMIREEFSKQLFELGFSLQSFALKEIFFPDEFKQARAESKGDEYDERLRRRDEERRQRVAAMQEMEAMKEFVSAVNTSGAPGSAPAQIKCPSCGTLSNPGTLFCPKCGKRL